MGHSNGDVQEAVGCGLIAQGRNSSWGYKLEISRMQIIIKAMIAAGTLKLSSVRKKCTRVREDTWEYTHLKGALKNENIINKIEKNYPKEQKNQKPGRRQFPQCGRRAN